MSDVLLPVDFKPTNLSLAPDSKVRALDGDLYGICDRIRKEVSPALFVVIHEDGKGNLVRYVIMEHCDDGVDRLVLQVGPGHKIDGLDARVIERLRYLLKVPFEQRLAELDREQREEAAKAHEDQLDDLVERLGLPMWRQLEHDGFITSRGKSLPKAGVATKGKRRK